MLQALGTNLDKYTLFKLNVTIFQNITQASLLKQVLWNKYTKFYVSMQQLCSIWVKISYMCSIRVCFKNNFSNLVHILSSIKLNFFQNIFRPGLEI